MVCMHHRSHVAISYAKWILFPFEKFAMTRYVKFLVMANVGELCNAISTSFQTFSLCFLVPFQLSSQSPPQMSEKYYKGPRCGYDGCPSRKYYDDETGMPICQNGHEKPELRKKGRDDEDAQLASSQGRTTRKKRELQGKLLKRKSNQPFQIVSNLNGSEMLWSWRDLSLYSEFLTAICRFWRQRGFWTLFGILPACATKASLVAGKRQRVSSRTRGKLSRWSAWIMICGFKTLCTWTVVHIIW